MISEYILVFRTNLDTEVNASIISKQILSFENVSNCNFDLDDCDKILRVVHNNFMSENIIKNINVVFATQNFNSTELLD